MTPSAVAVRPAVAADLPALAALIGRLNARPASQSLHCAAGTPAALRAALRQPETFPDGWERVFVVGETVGGEITGALGCQFDPAATLGWLWGPWVEAAADWPAMGDALLAALPLPRSVRRLEAFLHAENRAGLSFLRSRGFSLGPLTHIYVVRCEDGRADPADEMISGLRAAHEVGFARLHAETFPAAGSRSADELLAGRDEEHAIFAAADGLRLLGYVCVSVNRAPVEGFVEYLAVRPSVRGRGLGGRLLRAALRWAFEEKRLPQTALCVSEWRAGAQRLYESAGFRLQASGIAARRSFTR